MSDTEIIGPARGSGGGQEGGPSQGTTFAYVGGLVYHKALERGLGRQVPTDWFLQNIRN